MIIDIMPRQTGKTTKIALELVTDEKVIAVVATEDTRQYFIQRFKCVNDIENRVMTISKLIRNPITLPIDAVIVIDEIGWCLELLCSRTVKFATHTNEEIQDGD